jgi:tetratricopeptide (TPR) repeat protein/transcriptional regulator with XRE-family HTH domain
MPSPGGRGIVHQVGYGVRYNRPVPARLDRRVDERGTAVPTVAEQSEADGHDAVRFGELLRSQRERALLTQEQLAERSGLNARTIRRLERGSGGGRPHAASLRRLAAALGLDTAQQEALVGAARGVPDRREDRPTQSTGAVQVTRQLPAPPPQFTGRAADSAALEEVRAGPGPLIIAIDGMAGVGKTAFAVHTAHRWSSHYPDGQIFLDLQGYTRDVRPVEPGDALHRLLRSLGVAEAHVPDDLDDRAALYRSRLAGRRVLVLLDNAVTESQVAPLLPGEGSSLALITSRRRLTGLDLTYAHSLDLLPTDDAVALFVRGCGSGRVRDEPGHRLTEAVELCGRLPLAIRIAAARLRSRPSWTVVHIVERLRSVQDRLVELEVGERSVTAALELSYVQLDPELRSGYRLLGLHPGPELDPAAAAALTGRPAPRVRRLLDHLVDAHLLNEPMQERFRFHELTRAHAASAAAEEETEPGRRAALGRLFGHYCGTVRSAVVTAYPYERENRPGITGEPPFPGGQGAAAAWLDTELANLLAVADFAGRHDRPDCVVDLSGALHRHLRTRGRFADATALHELALACARRAGDRAGELDALNDLGHIRRLQGERQQAADLFTEVLRSARGVDDRHGELNALVGLGQIHLMQSRYAQAVEAFGEAQRIAESSGHRGRELEGLLGLGWVRLAQGRAAVEAFERAGELARSIGHSTGLVRALTGLGYSHRRSGRFEDAMAHFEQALEVARASGESLGELDALTSLGSLHRGCGRFAQADALYQQTLRRAREIGSGSYEFEALHGSGRLHQAAGRHHEALADHERALDVAAGLGQAAEEARAHDGIAHAHRGLGRPESARRHWQRALSILTALGSEATEDMEVTTASIRAHLASLADGAP